MRLFFFKFSSIDTLKTPLFIFLLIKLHFFFNFFLCRQVIELQRRLDNARSQINRLSGINYNKDEQLHRLELLRNQLKQKQHLIKKYKNIQF